MQAWTAASSRRSGSWSTRPTRCGSSSRATPGSWWATSRRRWPGSATAHRPSWSASNRASSDCSRPCWPCPGWRPRTWSGTRPGCSSTPAGASNGPSPWCRLVRAVLVRRRAAVVEDLLVESLLKTSDSLITFRRRSGSDHAGGRRRSTWSSTTRPTRGASCTSSTACSTTSPTCPTQSPAGRLGDEQRLVLEATTMLRLTDAGRLAAVDPDADRRPELDSVLGPGRRSAGRAPGQPAPHLLRPRATVRPGRRPGPTRAGRPQ